MIIIEKFPLEHEVCSREGKELNNFYRIRKGLNYEDANTGAVNYGCFFCCVDW